MDYRKNKTLEWLDTQQRASYLPLTILLVVIMSVGIAGNTLVLIIYKRKFTRSSARCYILNLALADLSVSLVGIPYHVLDLTLILTYTQTSVCKMLSFLVGACTLSSVFILLVVGLDRYFKVCRPLKRQIKDFGDRKACLLASFVAIVLSIPHGIIYGESTVQTQVNNLTGVECFISDEFQGTGISVGYLGFNLLVFVMSVVFLLIIYGFICRKIYSHDGMPVEIALREKKRYWICCTAHNETGCVETRCDIESDNSKSNECGINVTNVLKKNGNVAENDLKSSLSYSKRDKLATKGARNSGTMVRHVGTGSKAVEKHTMKITLMMLTITCVFVISYLPFIIISILDSTDEKFWADRSLPESVFLDFMLRLYVVNNVANPIIYSFWDKKFRRETQLLFMNLLCCFRTNRRKINSSNHSGKSAKVKTKCIDTLAAKTNNTAENI